MRGRFLTRYDDGLLPARQGLLGADDLGGGVTHSRDGEEPVKELAGRPGGREHGRAVGQGAAGRSGAEAPLRRVRLARRGGSCVPWTRGRRVGQRRHVRRGCAAAAAPEPRLLLQPRAGMAKTEGVFSARAGPVQGGTCELLLAFCIKFPGGERVA